MVKARLYCDGDSIDLSLSYDDYCRLKEFVNRQFHLEIYKL